VNTWDFRVVQSEKGTLALREVHYDRSGAVVGYCEPEFDAFDNVAELKAQLLEMLEDIEHKPVLREADLPTDAPPADSTRKEAQ